MAKSIIQEDWDKCYICHDKRNLEEHHIFQGVNRKNSETYGLKVRLCHYCHNEPPEGVHFNKPLKRKLQIEAQEKFEERYSREKFLEVFGLDYKERAKSEGVVTEKKWWLPK